MTFPLLTSGKEYAKTVFNNDEFIEDIKKREFDMVIGEANVYIELFMKITEIPLKLRFITPALDSTIIQTEESPSVNSLENNVFKAAIFGLQPTSIDKTSYTSSLFRRIQNYVMHIVTRITIKNYATNN
jgi:hypothetical protein